jgi:hypothetical protein
MPVLYFPHLYQDKVKFKEINACSTITNYVLITLSWAITLCIQ